MYCNFNRAPNKLTNMLQRTAAWRDAFKVASRSASMRFWLLVAGWRNGEPLYVSRLARLWVKLPPPFTDDANRVRALRLLPRGTAKSCAPPTGALR
jgi:hypothetical protein